MHPTVVVSTLMHSMHPEAPLPPSHTNNLFITVSLRVVLTVQMHGPLPSPCLPGATDFSDDYLRITFDRLPRQPLLDMTTSTPASDGSGGYGALLPEWLSTSIAQVDACSAPMCVFWEALPTGNGNMHVRVNAGTISYTVAEGVPRLLNYAVLAFRMRWT